MVAGRNVNAQGGREARIRAFAAEHRARLAAERTGIDAPVLHGLGSSDAAEAEGEGGEELASPVASPMAAGRAAAPSPLPGERGTCRQIGMLLCSPLYVLLTLALCFLYFVVTGIQFWITDYLHEVVGEPKEKVLTAFAITSCTGPALGVVFGGWLVDRMGGYKDESGEAVCTALKVCAWFCIGAFAAAVPAALIEHFSAPPTVVPRTSDLELRRRSLLCFCAVWCVVSIWFVLFFGGALLPSATGVCMNAVDPSLRSMASSYSMFAYNLLGYACAPFICGLVADKVNLKTGFQTVMFVAALPVRTARTSLLIVSR